MADISGKYYKVELINPSLTDAWKQVSFEAGDWGKIDLLNQYAVNGMYVYEFMIWPNHLDIKWY